MMHRNKSADVHQFAMVPRAEIPRAKFKMDHTHKTTFDAGYLVPVFLEEVLPGDTFHLKMTAFARLATPIFPIMDNMFLDSFFFFVPARLVWENFVRMMGQQDNPDDSTSFVIPTMAYDGTDFDHGSLADYFGLPCGDQIGSNTVSVSTLPFRAYNLIYNEWFRDQNLIDSLTVTKGDSGDDPSDFSLQRRAKRHDYFTSCLPWPQKGDAVTLGFGTTAPVATSPSTQVSGAFPAMKFTTNTGGTPAAGTLGIDGARALGANTTAAGVSQYLYPDNLYADLSEAVAVTVNQVRTAFQVQKLLERDARGGTRYTEIVKAQFGVMSPDARLQRPEYLGGGSSPIIFNPIAQTSATGLTGGSSPLGNLSAVATSVARNHGFSQSFVEHGYVIGLVNVRADQTYQNGLRKLWSRSSRYDFYLPAFANLGEQVVTMGELYTTGQGPLYDAAPFGYQERWAEYRYHPSQITGQFRSVHPTPLDAWHLAQEWSGQPSLNQEFIEENPPLSRVLALGESAEGAQILFDSLFEVTAARPMPLYSVPGLVDHF